MKYGLLENERGSQTSIISEVINWIEWIYNHSECNITDMTDGKQDGISAGKKNAVRALQPLVSRGLITSSLGEEDAEIACPASSCAPKASRREALPCATSDTGGREC